MKAALSVIFAAAIAGGFALPAAAQQDRISHVVIYGNDPCPRAASGEDIVICAHKPETERYRIPRDLRDAPATDPASQSWANKAESLQYAGRTGIQSCSTVGPGGFTGCLSQMIAAARAERRQGASDAARVP
ncbi:MAG: hypothetical protein JWO81_339 [Alphaproteobacteria bacterium]|nr:hypothetical protein [Alphaproteobacteria bacterium]